MFMMIENPVEKLLENPDLEFPRLAEDDPTRPLTYRINSLRLRQSQLILIRTYLAEAVAEAMLRGSDTSVLMSRFGDAKEALSQTQALSQQLKQEAMTVGLSG